MKSSFLKVIFLFSLTLSLISCSATRQANKSIAESFETSQAFQQGFAGFVVYDPQQREFLYEHNAAKYFTPASNTKLFTFYTGLEILGDSVPGLKYTTSGDTLVFRGTGDPSFLHERLPESRVWEFLKNREEQLFYAPPKVTEKYFGPGWAWDDFNSSYSVERNAFPIYGNYVTFRFSNNEAAPSTEPAFFEGCLMEEENDAAQRSYAYRENTANRFHYIHSSGNNSRTQAIPFKQSPLLVAQLLKDTLNREVKLLQEVPKHLEPETVIYSIPTDSLYKRMLQVSDNFIAEQILLLAAGKISDTLQSGISIDYMQENFLQDLPDTPQWVDGSGLSRYNLFTPRTMAALLEKIYRKVPQERLFELLAAGGESGTIRNLYKGEEPYVFAKTGTLRNNHSLSGYLKTESGKVLIFSFMNSNYTVPSSHIKTEMEQILRTVRDNY